MFGRENKKHTCEMGEKAQNFRREEEEGREKEKQTKKKKEEEKRGEENFLPFSNSRTTTGLSEISKHPKHRRHSINSIKRSEGERTTICSN